MSQKMHTVNNPSLPKIFGDIGRCIYCDNSEYDNELTNEHIVPKGIGGKFILPKSSCKNCAKITSQIEQITLRGIFYDLRKQQGLISNKRKNQHVDYIESTDFDNYKKERIDIQNYPAVLISYVFDTEPGMLLKTNGDGPLEARFVFCGPINQRAEELLKKRGSKWLGSTIKAEYGQFALMLMKIAHSYAVAVKGTSAFDSFLPKLILRKDTNISKYVGKGVGLTGKSTEMHRLSIRIENQLLVVGIRLFAKFGAPDYSVVVGRCV